MSGIMSSAPSSSRTAANAPRPQWYQCNDADPKWYHQGRAWAAKDVEMKQAAVMKGSDVIWRLEQQLGDRKFAQSKWLDATYLKVLGWRLDLDDSPVKQSELTPFKAAFDQVGVNYLVNPHWHRLELTHHDGDKRFPETWARYHILVNFHEKALLTVVSESPAEANVRVHGKDKKKLIPEEKLVPLRDWSDVMFLALQQASTKLFNDPIAFKEIQHIFQGPILDGDVKTMCSLISEDSTNPDRFASKFPGSNFPCEGPWSYQFIATLGTGYSTEIAKMFATHKQQLGPREIDYVNLFNAPQQQYGTDEQGRDESDSDFEERATAPKWGIYMHLCQRRPGR